MSADSKPRIEWLDTLKIIGIFYIYLGHLGKDAGKLYPFVFSFHVPLFFFISGLVYKQPLGFNESVLKIKTTFLRVILPYFVFSLIGIAIYAIKWNYSPAKVEHLLLDVAMGVRNKVPLASLWFLPCLFMVVFYYTVANYIFKKPSIVFMLSLIIFCLTSYWFKNFPTSFFNVDSALYYLAFFSFGVLLSNKIKYDWPLAYQGKGRILMLSIILLSFIYFYLSWQFGTFKITDNIKRPELRYLTIFIITCIMFIPSIAIAWWLNINVLKEMGKNTLVLCGTEQIIKVMLLSFLGMLGLSPTFTDPLQAVLFTFLTLTVSWFTVIKIYQGFRFTRH